MDRRTVLKGITAAGTLAATGKLAAPAVAQGAKVLKFVPQANLANFDPIWGTQYVVRNASQLVWDTLYGMDSNLQAKRQMVESEEVSADGLTWTFKLRDGLKFHDGEKVLAKDVVASITRWSNRDAMGLMLKAIQKELVAVDDRTFKWVLSKPYPKMLLALGKVGTPCCFIMPERIAKTDPFKQIEEYVGSGPMKFVRADWKPGALAAFEKFKDYVPRSEPSNWWSGGKAVSFDRIEWVIMPDPATASAALQNGEIDWWEAPLTDLVPVLKRNRNIKVDIADPLGNIGAFRLNHMHPPFNNIKARQAVQAALSQEDYMRAVVGSDDKLWKPIPSFFTPGTPLYTEAGGEPLKGKRDYDRAKKLLAGGRLFGPARNLPGGAGPAAAEGHGRDHRRPPQEDRHDRRLRRHRLGHGRPAARLQEPARPGRLGHVPHLACRLRLREPRRQHRDPHQRREGLVRLARQRRGREGHRRLVRCQVARRGEGHHRPRQQGRHGARHLHPDRLLLRLPGLAYEPRRRGQRAAAVVLGAEESVRGAPFSSSLVLEKG